jgi:LemA protein
MLAERHEAVEESRASAGSQMLARILARRTSAKGLPTGRYLRAVSAFSIEGLLAPPSREQSSLEEVRPPSFEWNWQMELLILLFVLTALGVIVASLCHRLATLRNAGRDAFAQLDVQLRRRYDVLPSLVETARKHMPHEREALQAVIVTRNSAVQAERRAAMKPIDAAAIQQLSGAERALSEAVTRLFAVSRSYPAFREDANTRVLTDELKSLQHAMSISRQAYNDALGLYNSVRTTFPANHFAELCGFVPGPLLKTEKPQDRAPARVPA